MWTGNFQAYKNPNTEPHFCWDLGHQRFYEIQIMEIHLLYISTKHFVQMHPQKSSHKQLDFVKKPLFGV